MRCLALFALSPLERIDNHDRLNDRDEDIMRYIRAEMFLQLMHSIVKRARDHCCAIKVVQVIEVCDACSVRSRLSV